MLSERMYRLLLLVYPKRHRLEYGELMAQLFRDRMRRDGGGLRTLYVWLSIALDLAGSAWKERKEEVHMNKRTWIGAALVVVLLVGVVGATTLVAQSKGKPIVSVHRETKTYSPSVQTDDVGVALADAMNQAVQDGALDRAAADEIARTYSQPPEQSRTAPGEVAHPLGVSVWIGSRTYTPDGTNGLADALRRAVADGELDKDKADQVLRSFESEDTPGKWRHYTITAPDGISDVLSQAVAEGQIDQETADLILQSLDTAN